MPFLSQATKDRAFVLLCAALIFAFFLSYAPSAVEAKLRLICLDLGLHLECTDKEATLELADFNMYAHITSSLAMILSVGIVGALIDRWGRKPVLFVSAFGFMLPSFTFFFIHLEEHGFFRDNWRALILIATGVGGMMGGVFILLAALFTFLSDITHDTPESRATLFTAFEGLLGVGGVVGSLTGGYLMDISSLSLFTFSICLAGVFLFAVLFGMRETVPAEAKNKPWDWSYANSLGTLLILLPTKRTLEMLDEDAKMTFDRLNAENTSILDSSIDNLEQQSIGDGKTIMRRTSSVIIGSNASTLPGTIGADALFAERSSFADDSESLLDKPHVSSSHHNPAPFILPGAILEEAVDKEMVDAMIEEESQFTNGSMVVTSQFTKTPLLVPPPRGNALWLLSSMVCIFTIVVVGYSTIIVLFYKDRFQLTNSKISLIMSVGSVTKSAATFLVLPFIAPLLNSRMAELRALQVAILLCALGAAGFGLAATFGVEAGLFAAAATFATTSAVVKAFSRGLISTEVGVSTQGKIFAGLASIEVLCNAIAGTATLKVYSFLHDTPELIFYILAGIFALSACIPFFLSDTAHDFNFRTGGFKKHPKSKPSKIIVQKEEDKITTRLLDDDANSIN